MSVTYSLLCYTRKPSGREEANNEDIALSMHLALRSRVSGQWEPLNENYGVFFAAAVVDDTVPAEARRACVAGARLASEHLSQREGIGGAIGCNAVIPGIDYAYKSLKDPYLFRLKDGRFAVAATRTERGGAPDGSERSSFLLTVSRDLTSYTQLGMVRFATESGVHRPQVSLEGNGYVIRWSDDEGQTQAAIVRDVTAAAGGQPIVPLSEDAAGDGQAAPTLAPMSKPAGERGMIPTDGFDLIPDAIAGNAISLNEAEVERLIARFGRIHNVSVSTPKLTLSAGLTGEEVREAAASFAKTVVTLGYDDGSTAVRSVDWDESALAALIEDGEARRLRPGRTYTVPGRIRQTRYPVPFAVERADPSVFAWDFNGKPLFLFIATDDTGGNCIDPTGGATHMPLRVADSVEALSDEAGGRAREIDLLVRGDLNSEGRAMTGCFWAPELHMIGGRLSILFMPCFDGEACNPDGSANERAGKPDMWTGCCHIMQLKQDEDGRDLDPRNPANWTVPEPILGPEGEALNPVQRISLDMTVLTDSGRWYYLWQQVGSVWIATFDPSRPSRLTSQPRQIIVPEFAWDNLIAEGPNAVVREGRIYLIYSGSLVGIDYTTGLVSAPAGRRADLTDPAVWTKLDYPLQKSGLYNGQWQLGTGHGMWSRDEDGNLIYVFHNAEYDHGRYGGRDAQVRRVHWAADGMPVLDMQWAEELDPQYADITMEITIR